MDSEASLVPQALEALDVASLSYQEWTDVGMALHAEGYGWEAWDQWSRADERYRPGECERKWRTFRGKGSGRLNGGTIVQMALERGWEPPYDRGEALDWDGEVSDDRDQWSRPAPRKREEPEPENRIIDPTWVEAEDVAEPGEGWEGWRDLAAYLEALFEPGECVGYVTQAFEREGRWTPAGKGDYRRTAGEILQGLYKHEADLGSSIGEPNPESGAWIRFNPLDGEGVRNDNVAEFRYALVESDTLDVGRQLAIIRQLELPVAAMVHSGGKSVHAIVKVDAPDYDEYRRRVDFLYKTCAANGLAVDTQNKNPSRLSRMPGVTRKGRKQWLMGTDLGRSSWADWVEWLEEQNDDLPEPENLADTWEDLPELAPPLIDGVLRQGHKMLLAGPSKAGKSFALIELCIAIAEGREWLGFSCARGRVLYVNLELDRASCLHRFHDAYEAMGIEPEHAGSIDVWNLRGRSKPMDQLAPSLIRRAMKTRPAAVIIDPIYKVITGDENSADQMAAFCNQFDKVATQLGCAVIYCHHHSKGAQGGKRAMDRASGSGVFARDPDALMDMIELYVDDELRRKVEAEAVAGCARAEDRYPARRAAHAMTAWRIECTLREFAAPDPLHAWFRYPVHVQDEERLGRLATADDAVAVIKAEAKGKRKNDAEAIDAAMIQCRRDGVDETIQNVYERMPEASRPSYNNFRKWLQKGGRMAEKFRTEPMDGTQERRVVSIAEEAMLAEF